MASYWEKMQRRERSRDEERFSGRLWFKCKLSYAPEVRDQRQMIRRNPGGGGTEEAIYLLLNTHFKWQ